MKAACGKIIETGFLEQHFTPLDAFHIIEGWLIERDESPALNTDTSLPTAAANLIEFVIPAMSKASLSELAVNWTTADIQKSSDAFSIAMERIFYKDQAWVMKVFSQWARKNEPVYNNVIASTLGGIRHKLQDEAAFEKQLMALRAVCSENHLRETIQALVQTLRDRRSINRNEPARPSKKRKNTPLK